MSASKSLFWGYNLVLQWHSMLSSYTFLGHFVRWKSVFSTWLSICLLLFYTIAFLTHLQVLNYSTIVASKTNVIGELSNKLFILKHVHIKSNHYPLQWFSLFYTQDNPPKLFKSKGLLNSQGNLFITILTSSYRSQEMRVGSGVGKEMV